MINQAILLGHVGRKEKKMLKNGGELTVISIATSKKYKDSTGQYQEQTTWHNVNCFSKLSEIVDKYVQVGDLVFVQGEIQNKKIETGERAGQYIYSIHASDIRRIPKGTKEESSPKKPNNSQDSDELSDDEIPF